MKPLLRPESSSLVAALMSLLPVLGRRVVRRCVRCRRARRWMVVLRLLSILRVIRLAHGEREGGRQERGVVEVLVAVYTFAVVASTDWGLLWLEDNVQREGRRLASDAKNAAG